MASDKSKVPLNILLIGKTGHGKSSTGNSIIGRKVFNTSAGPKSETKEVKDAWTEDGQCEIKVVDGPGLEDTNFDAVQNKKQACENMAKALMMCNGGVHAFVLVIKFGCRFTEEEKRTISDLKQIFGESYLKNHGIIVFTGGDQFAGQMEMEETPGKSFTDWCRENDADFGNLFKECNFRVVMFNNMPNCEEGEKRNQRNELLDHVKQLEQTQGLYTSKHFQMYAEVRNKLVTGSQQSILEETLQKRINLLSAELGNLSINSCEKDIDSLDARVLAVYTEIGEKGQQQESMKSFIEILYSLSSTLKEIRTAIKGNNKREKQCHLEEISKRSQELEDSRMSTWGILAGLGIGLAILGACSVIAGLVTMGSGLLGFAYKFLKK